MEEFSICIADFGRFWQHLLMIKRIVDLKSLSKKKSLFFLGPRQTGKTTLLKKEFPNAQYINLLEADTYREFYTRPELLRQIVIPEDKLIIIDEIQKVPQLLDEVHNLIESKLKPRFILTGSSARSIKAGAANLLAGRAWMTQLNPLTSAEVGFQEKSIHNLMLRGGLPGIFESSFYGKDLSAYVGTYLREEIASEGLTRSVDRFSRFLDISGFCTGEVINFTKIGSDAAIPPRTVIEYFKILQDTLLGELVEPLKTDKFRKSISAAKFYLFDLGVANFLTKRKTVEPGNEIYGKQLEHFIFCELKAFKSYCSPEADLNFWRSQSQFEVDFVWDRRIGIEVKAKDNIQARDEKGLHALGEEVPNLKKMIVCLEKRHRISDSGVEIFPLMLFLKKLWANEIL